MIRWRSQTFNTEISLDVDSAEAIAEPAVKSEYGDRAAQIEETIKGYLNETYGGYGHRLRRACTGFDLSVALNHEEFLPYGFELVEGREFIAPPPPVPEGAVS